MAVMFLMLFVFAMLIMIMLLGFMPFVMLGMIHFFMVFVRFFGHCGYLS
jgi:hypothetical protein